MNELYKMPTPVRMSRSDVESLMETVNEMLMRNKRLRTQRFMAMAVFPLVAIVAALVAGTTGTQAGIIGVIMFAAVFGWQLFGKQQLHAQKSDLEYKLGVLEDALGEKVPLDDFLESI